MININVKADITIHSDDHQAIMQELAGLKQLIQAVIHKEDQIMEELDQLKAQVTANTTVIGSAKTLIIGIKQKLDAAIAAGPEALKALSAELKTADDDLAAAVAANTPAESTPTP